MIYGGLVSVTFRQLSCEEIVELMGKSQLTGIEWGGDVHVPHGDVGRAKQVGQITREAGLKVAAYGSYWNRAEGVTFQQILDTAVALEAPTIRIWAGKIGSADISASDRAALVAEAQQAADMAQQAGLTLSYEWHSFSLTDTNESAVRLLEEIGRENVCLCWQPAVDKDEQYCMAGLKAIKDKLTNVHVYNWNMAGEELLRAELAGGQKEWRNYLQEVNRTGRDHFALLEFVLDDSTDQFLRDAATLHQWLGAL